MPKSTFTCLDKIEVAPKVYLFKFSVDTALDYTPGQFISLEVAPKTFRSYSLVDYKSDQNNSNSEPHQVEFLVNTKSGGVGSLAMEASKIGDTFPAIGPLGKFTLVENDRPKIFVSTGTGVGPFVAMIKQTLTLNPNADVKLFFGVFGLEYDFCRRFFTDYVNNSKYPNFQIITCTDSLKADEVEGPEVAQGMVTAVLPRFVTDYKAIDFYICGNPYMVTDMEKLLQEAGASDNIYTEKYGTIAK